RAKLPRGALHASLGGECRGLPSVAARFGVTRLCALLRLRAVTAERVRHLARLLTRVRARGLRGFLHEHVKESGDVLRALAVQVHAFALRLDHRATEL